MTWWRIVGTGHEAGFTSLKVHASTSHEDHLFMAWALHKPRAHEIWRIVRGTRVFCGFEYIWDTPNVHEQIQEGDTLFHSFYLYGLEQGSVVWYYLNAPLGPYGLEIQGPLMSVWLLKAAAWTTRAYFASRTKGMFKTIDFTPPGGAQPTWIPDNDGLPFLDIRQACPDPWDPYHRRFIVCHGDVYRMDNLFIDEPATATLVLSFLDALTLTGAPDGNILWIANSPNFAGHFYVLFHSAVGGTGHWCLKTQDYGATWTAHIIDPATYTYAAGNIVAGDLQAESPHPAGHVLYAAIIVQIAGVLWIYRSLDEGETWEACPGQTPGATVWEPRLYIDPTDQAIAYVGTQLPLPDLYRTIDHGATWTLCDQGNHLGIGISPAAAYATMGTHRDLFNNIRVLRDLHIWKSSNFGDIWHDQGPNQYSVPHLLYRDHSPDFLYLARIANAPGPDGLYAQHVLFVSADEGSNMFGKAGAHVDEDDGAGDSIPWNCGGAAQEGVLTLPL